MMAQKHLHELLQEDQEPFLLKNYIADRRIQLKKQPISISKTTLQIKNRKPNSCFFSIPESPDVRKSPFLNFPSPANPKTPNSVFLHIPLKTSALILESAIRIQKNSLSSKPRKTQIRNVGFGLLGSILKKLGRKSPGKCEKVQENLVCVCEKSGKELGFSRSCNSHSRRESAVWSESNEEKSLDFETSSSCRSEEDFEEIEFESDERESEAFSSLQQSPFRFALQNSPFSGRQSPVIFSPAASPSRHKKEERENNEEILQKIQLKEEAKEEEEKDQFSPVSVLDPPFEDDDEEHIEGGDEDEDDYDIECTYAIVQSAKQQLLQKLCRFEKLAELDPIELEKRMLEEQDDEDENGYMDEEEENYDGFIREVLGKTSLQITKVSEDMKRLVLDLFAEEKREENENEVVVKRVCKRFDSWKEMESKTIDMMVELDFRRDFEGWKINREEMGETAKEIETAIIGVLIEELTEELVCQTGV